MDRFSRILIDQKSTSAAAENRIKQLMVSYNRTFKSSKPFKINLNSKQYLFNKRHRTKPGLEFLGFSY
jgi:hypothetical protein